MSEMVTAKVGCPGSGGSVVEGAVPRSQSADHMPLVIMILRKQTLVCPEPEHGQEGWNRSPVHLSMAASEPGADRALLTIINPSSPTPLL